MNDKNDGDTSIKVTVTRDERLLNKYVYGVTDSGFTFSAKIFDKGSVYGINNGRVSKLDIRKDGKILVNYDRGWDVKPMTPELTAITESVLKNLDSLGKETDIDGERRDLLGAVKANEGKVGHNRKFAVTICETLTKTVEVEASNREEAERLVKDKWRNSEYVLDADAFDHVEFTAQPVKREQSKQGGDIS